MRRVLLTVMALYLALIIASPRVAGWNLFLLNAGVFAVVAGIYFLGGEKYYRANTFLTGIFAAYLLVLMIVPEPPGLDKAFHFAGGIAAGWLAAEFYSGKIEKQWERVGMIVLVALGIGASWELFEYLLWLLPQPFGLSQHGIHDTMQDLIADAAGALTTALVRR